MKLISCYIENFGGLSGYSVDFDEKLTVINEANGFGKTTLAAFIKAMFYGFPKGAKTLEKNERKLYTPWQGGSFGGNLCFEHDGISYRIERFFGATPKQDSFTLYQLEPFGESDRYSEKIGLELFQLDVESYEKSTYMAQSADFSSFATAGIQTKLGDLVEEADDIYNFDKAVAALKDKRIKYKTYRGNGGSIYEINSKVSVLQARVAEKPQVQEGCDRLKEQLDALILKSNENENELEIIRKRITKASEVAVLENLNKQYLSLKEEKRLINAEAEKILSQYEKGLPTKEATDKADTALENIAKIDSALEALKVSEEARVAERRAFCKKIKILLFAFAVVSLLASVALFAMKIMIAAVPLFIAALILVVCAFIVKPGKSIAFYKNAVKDTEEFEMARESYQQNRNDQLQIVENFSFVSGIPMNVLTNAYFKKISEDIVRGEDLLSRLEKSEEKLESFEAENGERLKGFEAGNVNNLNQLKNEEADLLVQNNLVNAEILKTRQLIEQMQKELESFPVLEDELEDWNRKFEEDKKACEIIDQTIEYLSEAKDKLTYNYINPVRERFECYVNQILRSNKLKIFMDKELKVMPEQYGEARELTYFSAGYTDIVRLCMHFALVDVLFKETDCFVILDDPFVNLDDEKTKEALLLLNELSERKQIVYLVCNSSRV